MLLLYYSLAYFLYLNIPYLVNQLILFWNLKIIIYIFFQITHLILHNHELEVMYPCHHYLLKMYELYIYYLNGLLEYPKVYNQFNIWILIYIYIIYHRFLILLILFSIFFIELLVNQWLMFKYSLIIYISI